MEEFEGQGQDERMETFRKAQRLIFINDVERYHQQPMPMGVLEFVDLFGSEPSDEDKDILTQVFMKNYMSTDIDDIEDINKLIDKWGLDWLQLFLEHNEETEEYELCAIIKEVIDSGTDQLKSWMRGIEDVLDEKQ